MTNKLDFGRGGLAKTLTGFMAATDPFGFQPTLAVPRSILDRQSRLFQQVSAEGAELTVHDGTSPDGQPAAPAKYGESVRAAVDTFRKKDIPLSGLRTIGSDFTDQPAREMLAGLGVTYTYGRRLAWEVMDREQFPPGGLEEFERLKAAYGAGDPLVESSLPSGGDPIPDLPVVLPDDRALTGIMRLPSGSASSVWLRILSRVYRLGELMLVDLSLAHFEQSRPLLEAVLSRAKEYSPAVWMTTAGDAARWWSQRKDASLEIRSLGEGRYELEAKGVDRVSVLVRNAQVQGASRQWHQGYELVEGAGAVVESPVRPAVAVGPGAPEWVGPALRDLGFAAEQVGDSGGHAFVVDGSTPFSGPRDLLAAIEASDAPLARVGMWPQGAACALCIAGDVQDTGIGSALRRVLGR